jgi:hypothetical protein
MDAHNNLGANLGPLRKLFIALSPLLAFLWAAGASVAVAQDSNCAPYSTYCLAGIANVQTDVPTTSLGGGGQAFIHPGQLAEWVASSGGSADSPCVGVQDLRSASSIGLTR